ncbi:MAG: hypothetical protein ACK5LK_03265, partial [Chthoniobacterales bacterium]
AWENFYPERGTTPIGPTSYIRAAALNNASPTKVSKASHVFSFLHLGTYFVIFRTTIFEKSFFIEKISTLPEIT